MAKKLIKLGIAAAAVFALARGCGCINKGNSEPEKKPITSSVYDISEAISNSHIKNSYVSTMQKMGEAKGLILQYMTDETISVNLDSEVRKYIIDGMRGKSLNSGFDVSSYMESFSEFAKDKKTATRTLDNIIDAYDAFMGRFEQKENEAEFLESYIEDKEKLSQFVAIGKSMVSALDIMARQYQEDKKYFDELAQSLSQENDPAAEKLLTQISNYSDMCTRMSSTIEHQKQRIAVEIEYIESAMQENVVSKTTT